MTNLEFVEKLLDIEANYRTLYVMGCFGAPLNEANKKRYTTNHEYNKKTTRTKMINNATDDTFGFDCVNMIKAVLWGWNGDKNKSYGGAKYQSNNVPDIGADTMITKCKDLSTDFSKIEIGEAVWLKGHIGIYIGNGLAVECSPKWDNSVQITACNKTVEGYNKRNWTSHGKLPYIEYKSVEAVEKPVEPVKTELKYKVGDIVEFVGTKHYVSADATNGKNTVPGLAKVTNTYDGKHPLHLRAINKNGKFVSGVWGWVDLKDVKDYKEKELEVGDKVKLNKGAKVYGKSYCFQSWVYNATLYVRAIEGDCVIVSTQKKGAITGAVNKKDLTLL